MKCETRCRINDDIMQRLHCFRNECKENWSRPSSIRIVYLPLAFCVHTEFRFKLTFSDFSMVFASPEWFHVEMQNESSGADDDDVIQLIEIQFSASPQRHPLPSFSCFTSTPRRAAHVCVCVFVSLSIMAQHKRLCAFGSNKKRIIIGWIEK